MKAQLYISFLLLSLNSIGQHPGISWAKQITCSSNVWGVNIVTDQNGNIFTAGGISGQVNFDPSSNTATVNCGSSWHTYLAKYNSQGSVIWGFAFGNQTFGSRPKAIAMDANNNIYVAGEYFDVVDFDPSPNSFTLATPAYSIGDIYVVKYDNNGNFLWAKGLIGSEGKECTDLQVDANGNIYVTGGFSGTVDFDASSGVSSLTSAGVSDGFVAKYDPNFSLVWAHRLGGSNGDAVNGVCVESSGKVGIAGVFSGTSDMDPSVNTFNLSAPSATLGEGFVASFTSTGGFLWAEKFGYKGGGAANKLTCDGNGNYYVTGNDSTAHICMSKFNSTGTVQWNNYLKSNYGYSWPEDNEGKAINFDASGYILISGHYRGKVDFDPSTATYTLTSHSAYGNPFFAKYDLSGNFMWVSEIAAGGPGFAYLANGLCHNNNTIYIAGSFNSTVDMDPTPASYTLTAYSGTLNSVSNAFIAKYDQNPVAVSENNSDGHAMHAYPNPTRSFIFIDSEQETKVSVCDALGKIVHEQALNIGSNKIDLEQLAPGVYFILQHRKSNQPCKIIKY